jgi:hypothetical protein
MQKPPSGWGGIRITEFLPGEDPVSKKTSAHFDASGAGGLSGGSNPVAEDVLTLAERIAALPPEVRAVLATLFGASQGSYSPAPKDR